MKAQLNQYHYIVMKGLELTVLTLCIFASVALIPLDSEQLQKDYAIGRVEKLFFPQKTKVIFVSEGRDLFGVLNGETGKLESAYELEADEHILNLKHWSEIIIGRGKTINQFIPDIEEYFRLQESFLIQDRDDFTQVLGYSRHNMGSYILTDTFLMRVKLVVFPEPAQDGRNFQIEEKIVMKKEDPSQTYHSMHLISYKDVQTFVRVVSTIKTDTSYKVCFTKVEYNKEGPKIEEKQCVTGPQGQTLKDVVLDHRTYYIQFTKTLVSYNKKLQKTGQLEEPPVQYYHNLPIVGKKHKAYNGATGQLIDERPVIENQRYSSDRISMKVFEEKIEILDNEKLIVTIAKKKEQEPRKAWSYYDVSIAKQHYFFIEFEDGKLVNYVLDEPLSRYEKKWEIQTNQEKKIEDKNKMISLGDQDTRPRLRPPVNEDEDPTNVDIPDQVIEKVRQNPYPDEGKGNLPGQGQFPSQDDDLINRPNEDERPSQEETSQPQERQPEPMPLPERQGEEQPFDESTQPKRDEYEAVAPADVAPPQAPEDGVLPVIQPLGPKDASQKPEQTTQQPVSSQSDIPASSESNNAEPESEPEPDLELETPQEVPAPTSPNQQPLNEPSLPDEVEKKKPVGNLAREPEDEGDIQENTAPAGGDGGL